MSSGQEVGEIFGDGAGPANALLRSPTVIIASVGLWGMNIYLFRLFGIDYAYVLTLDLIKEKETALKDGNEDDEGSGKSTPSNGKTHHHHGPTSPIANPHKEVTSYKLIFFSLFLLALLHASTSFWLTVIGGSIIGAIFSFYSAVILGIALPLPSTSWIRTACATIFHRTFELINPRCFCLSSGIPRPIPFVDVFLPMPCVP